MVITAALLCFESDLLWKLQEQNLFLNTGLFFKEQMVVPGGLLSWLGTFLTQLFYYPWIGTTALCWLWLLMMWMVKRTFRLTAEWSALALVPVGLLLLTIVDMGYWVYILKLQGHVFVGTLGVMAVVALLWAYRCLPDRRGLRSMMIVATAAVGYPLLGIYGLAAALLMGVWSWRIAQGPTWKKVVQSVLALASAAIVPLACYRLVYYQTNLANIYFAKLPLYFVTEEHHAYYIPYYLLALFFLGMTLMPFGKKESTKQQGNKSTGQQVKKSKRQKGQVPPIRLVTPLLLVVLVAGVATFWYKDENFHHELRMQHYMEQNNWEGMVKEAGRQKDEPTRAIVMMRNLALSRLGRQGDEMFRYANGSKAYASPFGMRLMMAVGPQMYYQYGLLNYCSRLSTELGVEFGWRVADLKLLAKCALLRDELPQARKYLDLLRHTTFHKGWAEGASHLPELADIRRMMHYENYLGGDQGNTEAFLMKRLAESTDTSDPFFQEQTLLASLWTKSINQFWYHFTDYVRLHPKARIPRYYQEAAYLYGQIEGREDIDRWPIDESVKQTFARFAKAAEPFDNGDVNLARKALQAYRHTYFYDYYLMRQLVEY